VSSTGRFGPVNSSALRALLDKSVSAAMARTGVPGVAVGVRVGSEEVTAGYGVTSVENPLPVHDQTLFQIGSVSKTFTATAVMALVERGQLALDDRVRRHLPKFRLLRRGVAEQVTVRHLLTHTAGFVGDWFLVHPLAPEERGDSVARQVDRLAAVPQLFPPGTGWSYNNAGFAVAGRIVEVLTGRPFAPALRDLVLGPLELQHTFTSADEAITHRVAIPHTSRETPPRVLRKAGWQPGWELTRAEVPLGGLISSVRDLLGWARFHLGQGTGSATESDAPLTSATISRMQVPLAPAGCFAEHVGVAWMLREVAGRRVVGHGGLTTGYATAFTLVPEADTAVVVLTNATPGGTWLARDVTREILGETIGLDDVPPAPVPGLGGDGSEYAGRYDNPFAVQEIVPGMPAGELVLRHHARPPEPGRWAPPPPGPIRLAFYAPDRVVALEPPDQASLRGEFGRDSRGRVVWLRWGGRVAPRLAAGRRPSGQSGAALA
jgi:CubicO group peptidase (beta-lactamase class C family)